MCELFHTEDSSSTTFEDSDCRLWPRDSSSRILRVQQYRAVRHCELGTAAVASSRTTDLPAIIRFLIVHHLSAENAAGFGSGAPPARERVQHVAPRHAYKSCVSGAAGSVLGPIGTTTAAGGHPCSSCCSTARRRAVDGQGTQHAAG